MAEADISANEVEHDPGVEQGTNDETEESAEPPNAGDDDVDGIVLDDPTVEPKTTPVALSLLYLLFILSLALPGSVLVGNVLPCSDVYRISEFNPQLATWHTNSSVLPQAVQEWDSKNGNYEPYDFHNNPDPSVMFAHIEGSLYIRGALDRPPVPRLVVVSGGEPPRKVGDFKDPQWVTAVANKYICFVTTDGDFGHCWRGDVVKSLWCGTEGNGFNKVALNRGVTPMNLVAIDGLLWFQQTYSNDVFYSEEVSNDDFSDPISDVSSGDDNSSPTASTKIEPANGYAIVSIEPENMNTTIHSSLKKALDSQLPNQACTVDTFSGLAAVCLLLVAALPMTILSGWAWVKKGVPSSSVALYLSLGLLLTSAFSIGGPFTGSDALSWWLMMAGPFWVFGCSFLLVVNARVSQGPLWWSVYFLSILAFCATISTVVGIDYEVFVIGFDDNEVLYGMALFSSLVVFLPLTLIGILLGSTFIFSLGALGIVVDVAAFTSVKLRDQLVVAAVVVLIEVVVLSVAAILVYRRRNFLRDRMVMCLTRCTRRLCGGETATAQDDKQATDSLLGGDELSEGGDHGEIL